MTTPTDHQESEYIMGTPQSKWALQSIKKKPDMNYWVRIPLAIFFLICGCTAAIKIDQGAPRIALWWGVLVISFVMILVMLCVKAYRSKE